MQREIECLGSAHGEDWALYHGDCVRVMQQLPDNSVDLGIHSPPFSTLYTYSDSPLDMGNNVDDEAFFRNYRFAVEEHFRITRPGRLVVVHCKDLPKYQSNYGVSGLRDFPGDVIRVFEAAGFVYVSRVQIWKSPVDEMYKTKAHGLLYKTLREDAAATRQGIPDYLVVFRKWPTEADEHLVRPVTHTREDFPLPQWQQWASPAWTDIDLKNVLNVAVAADDKDEKHICPLQLDVIERCVHQWSNPGDVVFSPFTGIGSEGFVALRKKRRFVGIELKGAYFRQAAGFLAEAARGEAQLDLLASGSAA